MHVLERRLERAAHRVVDRPLPDALDRRPQPLAQLGPDGGLQLDEAVVAERRASRTTEAPLVPGPAGDLGHGAEGHRLGVVDDDLRHPALGRGQLAM